MIKYDMDALEYISKLSEGGLRDAISLMDKCLAFSKDLTLENVVKALGTIDYDTMISLTDNILSNDVINVLMSVETIFSQGKDLKQFIKQYMQFILDVLKKSLGCDWKYLSIPRLKDYEEWIINIPEDDYAYMEKLLSCLVSLNSEIKYSSVPKTDIEAELLLFMRKNYA